MGIRINALTETTSPGDTDNGVLDTSAGTRRITWSNIKTAIFGAINGLTSKSTPVGADVIAIGDSAASFAGKKVTINELLAPLRNTARVEKTTHTQYNSTIPADNTIPQNTEGSEIFNVSHTPTNANNYIRVKAVIGYCHDSSTASFITAALFKDSGANAVAVQTKFINIGTNNDGQIVIDYRVLAGSTSSATWSLRMGSSSGQTFTVSGRFNSGLFGGVYISSMTVTEEIA